ncbi:ECF transporter S component [Propionicicella superfundia]|uniref:ECF transporter S component n=1 Tax=Propionicicella superfundia TaxID=348582 RepID=UPI0003F79251|nr:ECF transporter S component [Propionicicella superfundia]
MSNTVSGMDAHAAAPPRKRHTTRTIMTAAAIGAGVGVILIPLNFISQPIAVTMPLVAVVFYGVWGMAALIPLAHLRMRGAGIIGSTAAGLVSSLSPYGLFMVVMMLGWGLLMELPFAVARYRHFGWRMFLIAGVVTGVISSGMSWAMLDLGSMKAEVAVATCVVQVASFVVCSMLSLLIARSLGRAGIGGRPRAQGDV